MQQRPTPSKKLYRSRKDKMLAGVCGGLADYFAMDSSWMRLIFILFLILGGSAILVYSVMWMVVPKEPLNTIFPDNGTY